MLGEGVTVGAGNVIGAGRAYLPRRELPDGAHRVLSRAPRPRLDARRDSRASTRLASSPTSSPCPSTCATRCGGSRPRGIEPFDAPGGLVVAGMGGSAIGGDLARAALGDRALAADRRWRAATSCRRGRRPTRPCCARSYSGNTEETLACYEAAGALGAPRVVATTGGRLAELARADGVPVIPLPGGFQPRAAVAYMMVAALEVAALCGAGPSVRTEVDVAAAHAEQLVVEWGPDGADDAWPRSWRARLHEHGPA